MEIDFKALSLLSGRYRCFFFCCARVFLQCFVKVSQTFSPEFFDWFGFYD
jgi:hypothetical protein